MADDRFQIRMTLLDSDLSEGWLRAKVQQLLDSCDALEAERDVLQEALRWIAKAEPHFYAGTLRATAQDALERHS